MDRDDARFVQFREQVDGAVADITDAVNALVIQRDISASALDKCSARCAKLEEALRVIRKPPMMWDSPESRDTEEVRFRIRVADAALKAEG